MAKDIDQRQLQSFQRYLQSSKKILCIVGAGLSASSGIPTYQLSKGSWKGYTSLDLATPEAFQQNPGLVWQFYSSRRFASLKAKPNDGHFALAELSRRLHEKQKEVLVVSQNVDGLHQRSGQTVETLAELHGSLFNLRCTSFFCGYKGSNSKDLFLTARLRETTPRELPAKSLRRGTNKRKRNEDESDEDKDSSQNPRKRIRLNAKACIQEDSATSSDFDPLPHLGLEELPRCPECNEGLLRPGVVWYGESLPLLEMDKVDHFFSQGHKVDLVLVIGTSGKVWPAMGYVERVKKTGGKVAIFNTTIEDLERVRHDKTVWGFQGDAAEWLPKALEPVIGRDYKPRDWLKR